MGILVFLNFFKIIPLKSAALCPVYRFNMVFMFRPAILAFNVEANQQVCAVNRTLSIQKQPPEVFCKNRCSQKFRIIHSKTPVLEA